MSALCDSLLQQVAVPLVSVSRGSRTVVVLTSVEHRKRWLVRGTEYRSARRKEAAVYSCSRRGSGWLASSDCAGQLVHVVREDGTVWDGTTA